MYTHMLAIYKVSCYLKTSLHTQLVLVFCIEICGAWGSAVFSFHQNSCSNSNSNVSVIVLIIMMT